MTNIKRRPMVAGNWKMNGSLPLISEFKIALSENEMSDCDVIICPAYPYLSGFDDANVKLGAQNLSEFDSGAHTGEVSADMLRELACEYVIVGHSERRADNHETNQLVAVKVKKAIEAKLTPIFCVGEPETIRESGELFNYIAAQIDAVVDLIGISAFASLVIAYEPVWAIGTGKTATPEQAQEVHLFIRQHLAKLDAAVAENVKILYGGSVKAANADELFAQADVDGGLIGGASLKTDEFISICQAANARG